MIVASDMLTALAQEPWCFTPDTIASLTDYQVVELYLKPAGERARRSREELPAPRPLGTRPRRAAEPDHEPGTPGHRRQIVDAAFVGQMGMTREAAEALYDRQLAAWLAQRNGGE